MTKPSGPAQRSATEALHDRRSNPELRRLIEEMLERVRQMNRNVGIWSAEQRARAEADLESIMARVRRLAGERHTE
jgi:2-keto-3-deoxy-L-rhamnonate aldolase RhmA